MHVNLVLCEFATAFLWALLYIFVGWAGAGCLRIDRRCARARVRIRRDINDWLPGSALRFADAIAHFLHANWLIPIYWRFSRLIIRSHRIYLGHFWFLDDSSLACDRAGRLLGATKQIIARHLQITAILRRHRSKVDQDYAGCILRLHLPETRWLLHRHLWLLFEGLLGTSPLNRLKVIHLRWISLQARLHKIVDARLPRE